MSIFVQPLKLLRSRYPDQMPLSRPMPNMRYCSSPMAMTVGEPLNSPPSACQLEPARVERHHMLLSSESAQSIGASVDHCVIDGTDAMPASVFAHGEKVPSDCIWRCQRAWSRPQPETVMGLFPE